MTDMMEEHNRMAAIDRFETLTKEISESTVTIPSPNVQIIFSHAPASSIIFYDKFFSILEEVAGNDGELTIMPVAIGIMEDGGVTVIDHRYIMNSEIFSAGSEAFLNLLDQRFEELEPEILREEQEYDYEGLINKIVHVYQQSLRVTIH